MLRRYCLEKFCISGVPEIPACIFVAGGRKYIKDLLVQARDKDKHDVWSSLAGGPFQGPIQNKYFTCVKIPQASSFLRRKIPSPPPAYARVALSKHGFQSIIKPIRSCAFYRLRFYEVTNGAEYIAIYISRLPQLTF